MSNIGKILGEFVTDHLDGVHPFTIRPIFQATVTSLGAIGNSNPGGTVQVKRPGDINPTGYNYRVPSWYVPAVGDTVIVLNVPKTPLVLCRVANSLFDTLLPPANTTSGSPGQLGFKGMTASPQSAQLAMSDSGKPFSGLFRGYGGMLSVQCSTVVQIASNYLLGGTAPSTVGTIVSTGADCVTLGVFPYSSQTKDLQQWFNLAGSAALASMDISGRIHAAKTICNTGPCVASGINAGITSATVSVTGSDQAGDITFTTTATPPAAGTALMTLTFASAFLSSTTPRVIPGLLSGIPPSNGLWYSGTRTNASWQLACTTALAASTTYSVQFLCGE